MQVTNKKETPKFTPITIEITFESLDELKMVYALTNVSNNDVLKQAEEMEVSFDDYLGNKPLYFYKEIKSVINEYL